MGNTGRQHKKLKIVYMQENPDQFRGFGVRSRGSTVEEIWVKEIDNDPTCGEISKSLDLVVIQVELLPKPTPG